MDEIANVAFKLPPFLHRQKLSSPTARENAREISLAENVVRAPMHPDDECEAFNRRVVEGLPVEDVAARYGVTPAVVKQRLKLAAG
jgi:ParB-like chromosome segregation protein Spo0J